MTLFCLRFACILCRSRDDKTLPSFRLIVSDNRITVGFAKDWADTHPLTMFDLRQESKVLDSIGVKFRVNTTSS
jgi:exopolyphosphatase/pppGpp-phosphohydrolase